MAGPGRPRKIQNETASEDVLQEAQGEFVTTTDESSAIAVAQIEPVQSVFVEQPKVFVVETPPAVEMFVLNNPDSFTPHNWHPINTVSRNGFPVKLTDDVSKPGVICFWRKSRAFANATHRWEETGFWTRSDNGTKLGFIPLWWKDRNAE